MTVNDNKFPPCFGKIEIVFPLGEHNLREVPESCMFCYYRTNCLNAAVSGEEGLDVRQELTDRAYFSGKMNFFQRWSKRKMLQQCKNKKKA